MRSFYLFYLFFLLLLNNTFVFSQGSSISLTKFWEYPIENLTNFKIASDNVSAISFSANDSKIVSLSNLGKTIWENEISGMIISEPILLNDKIFLTAQESKSKSISIYLISFKTGLIISKKDIEIDEPFNSIETTPINQQLIIFINKRFFFSFSIESEKITLLSRLESEANSNLEVSNNSIYLATNNKILKYTLPEFKETIISQSNEDTVKICLLNEKQIVAANKFGQIYILDIVSKKRKSLFRVGANVNSIIHTGKNLIISSIDNFIYFLNLDKAKLVWKKRLDGRFDGIFLLNSQQFVATSLNKSLFFEISRGRLLNQIILEDEVVFTGSAVALGNLLIYQTSKGILAYTITENKRDRP